MKFHNQEDRGLFYQSLGDRENLTSIAPVSRHEWPDHFANGRLSHPLSVIFHFLDAAEVLALLPSLLII